MFMRKCQAKVFVAILILMICVFLLFTFLKSTAGKNKTKYPSSVNCNLMNSQFTKEEMRAYAVLDKDATLKQHGAGFYQCYCKANSSPKDIGSDRDENFCDDYQIDIQTGLLLTTVVTVLVSIFNIIIRTVNMNLIDRIGYDTHSERYSAIMTSIFIASYINTGIILSLTNANLSYTFLGFIPIQNQFADFTPSWFTQIGGSLTQTLLIQAFMPYVEICIALTIKTLLKWKDGGFPCCPRGAGEPKTKKVTNQQYINLYAGPEYMMHFRYSSIMLLVFVAFTYGLFLPVMFPIAGIGIFNMYVVERMTLAYYYRQPPMFDEKLNARAIDLLQQAPIMMFLIAYWAFGNQQIFFNQPPAVYDHGNGAQDTRHPAFYFAKPNQTMIILLVLLYLLMDNFGYKLRHQMFRMVRLIQDGSSKLKADVDENLANYWQAISGIEQKLWYSNEVYDRYNTGVQAMSDEALEKLRTSQRSKHKKHIKGNANYKVLFNMQYQQKFQYQPLDERNEAEDNELSDIITKLLNMNDHMSKPVVIGDDGA